MQHKLYIFDFDGTITHTDSFIQFIIYAKGWSKFLGCLIWLAPLLVLMKLKLYSNEKLKQQMFSLLFKDDNYQAYKELAAAFVKHKIPPIIRTSFLAYYRKITSDKANEVVLVSASLAGYLAYWSDQMNLNLICTQEEVKADKLTGKFATRNCYGMEKTVRIRQQYDLEKYHEIHVFGDSEGDKAMLELATHKYYKFF